MKNQEMKRTGGTLKILQWLW